MHSLHECSRQRRDAAQPLQQIQNYAFTGEDHAGVVANDRDLLPFVQPYSIKNFGMAGDFVMRNYSAVEDRIDIEYPRYTTDTRQNTILFRKDRTRRTLVGINAGIAGRIARGPVLEQRVFKDRGNAPAIPVHKNTCGAGALARLTAP